MKQREAPNLRDTIDELANLPPHITDQILSRMLIKDAVRTSILSRKWRYKWATISNLVFSDLHTHAFDFSQDETKIINMIGRVLLLHNGPILKFQLSHSQLEGESYIDQWILHILRNSIKEFILLIFPGEPYKLPSALFSCESLIFLKLIHCLLEPPPTFEGFKNLKSLHLSQNSVSRDVLENLITSCPMLERFTLVGMVEFSHLDIDAPNLHFVNIRGHFTNVRFKNTFRLALVSLGFWKDPKDEIMLAPGSCSEMLSFFVHLPHIRRLKTEGYFLKYLAFGNVPERLPQQLADLNHLSIDIDFNDLDEGLSVLCLLRSSPNLQELNIMSKILSTTVTTPADFWIGRHWNTMLAKLRLVNITKITGDNSELDFIEFLLSNSPKLERMNVKPACVDEESELMKILLRFQRASMAAEIIYLN